MAHPKRRHSNSRTRLRRSHDFLEIKYPSRCSQCKALVFSHRICPACGYYRGRPVISIKVKEDKQKK